MRGKPCGRILALVPEDKSQVKLHLPPLRCVPHPFMIQWHQLLSVARCLSAVNVNSSGPETQLWDCPRWSSGVKGFISAPRCLLSHVISRHCIRRWGQLPEPSARSAAAVWGRGSCPCRRALAQCYWWKSSGNKAWRATKEHHPASPLDGWWTFLQHLYCFPVRASFSTPTLLHIYIYIKCFLMSLRCQVGIESTKASSISLEVDFIWTIEGSNVPCSLHADASQHLHPVSASLSLSFHS